MTDRQTKPECLTAWSLEEQLGWRESPEAELRAELNRATRGKPGGIVGEQTAWRLARIENTAHGHVAERIASLKIGGDADQAWLNQEKLAQSEVVRRRVKANELAGVGVPPGRTGPAQAEENWQALNETQAAPSQIGRSAEQGKLDARSQDLHSAQVAVEELRRTKEALEQQAAQQNAELARVTSALEAEQSALREARKTTAQLTAEQTRLQQELAAYARQAEQWQRDQKAFEELLQSETREREQLNAQLAEITQAREAAETRVRTVEAEARELSTQRAALETELKQRTQAVKQLRRN